MIPPGVCLRILVLSSSAHGTARHSKEGGVIGVYSVYVYVYVYVQHLCVRRTYEVEFALRWLAVCIMLSIALMQQ